MELLIVVHLPPLPGPLPTNLRKVVDHFPTAPMIDDDVFINGWDFTVTRRRFREDGRIELHIDAPVEPDTDPEDLPGEITKTYEHLVASGYRPISEWDAL